VAELADALDSKSSGPQGPCGFDSLLRHALFSITFDWLICPSNWQKVKEGNYLNRKYDRIKEWLKQKEAERCRPD
jgi:hypothetical protein